MSALAVLQLRRVGWPARIRWADFVTKVFLAEQVVIPVPPPAKPVVEADSDGDGVPDRLDKCPGTPRGARVDTDGCWVLADLNFHTEKELRRHFRQCIIKN